ncbi:hypothetical protein NR798_45545 [Archangium gephyra]|uniref:hypothetical protein n=1 Tax=Archangium gephyra TaxID=48 RepID=UPI0035D47A3F
MKRDGFKRAVVLGLAASALLVAGGCREERGRQGTRDVQGQQQAPGTGGAGPQENTGPGQEPRDLNRLPDEEGFQSVPKEQEAPSGIGLDGRGGKGGSGVDAREEGQEPADLNRLPDEEGFQSVPDEQEGRSGIKLDGRGGAGEEQQKPDNAR